MVFHRKRFAPENLLTVAEGRFQGSVFYLLLNAIVRRRMLLWFGKGRVRTREAGFNVMRT